MFGGVHQIIHDSTEEQRQRWLKGSEYDLEAGWDAK